MSDLSPAQQRSVRLALSLAHEKAETARLRALLAHCVCHPEQRIPQPEEVNG